ncbi:MAG: Ubiquinone biosynthesis COQ9 [Lasallia pustulata]|uniref:Ubiquinone biosynthesis protein n=1 Tax=Lasallia pustulata TaxID=136370 RepID=A0A5M8PRN5_9LECA|nr:MAG: Ubiquinone biosynthesis COQ9 [Lasallia pustulata]
MRSSRPVLLNSRRCSPAAKRSTPYTNRSYHSYEHDEPPPFNENEKAILSAALSHVPAHGFTTTSLSHGARDAGYLDASVNLFPRGAFDLVIYHLVTQRLALKDHVQFPEQKLGVGAKVRLLALQRLWRNKPIIHKWQEALAVMAQPSNLPASLAELARLSDEIWFLAGDSSVDTSWYTKRAGLSAIYSSTEVFMTQDTSADFVDTERFFDRQLQVSRTLGGALASIGQWVNFTGHASTNILRSKGVWV